MKTDVERLEKNKLLVRVELDAAELSKATDKACRALARKVSIPGFRKGRAPRHILEMRLGKETIRQEALELLLPEAYSRAVKQAQIEPIEPPEIELVQAEEGSPVVFKATVEVKPEVELGQYVDLEVKKDIPMVTEDEVERAMETVRESHGKLVAVEGRAVEEGDFVLAAISRTDKAPAGDAKGLLIQVGGDGDERDLGRALLGALPGEEREIRARPTQDAGVDEVVYRVTVKEVKRKELPELNDEFARQVGEFADLEELKVQIANRLKQEAEERAQREFDRRAVEEVVARASVEIPESMVQRGLRDRLEEMSQQLARRGTSLEAYLSQTGENTEAVKQKLRPAVEKELKTNLVLEAVAAREGISVADEEVEEEIGRIAARYGPREDAVGRALRSRDAREGIADALRIRKTVKFLAGRAKVVL